MSKLITFRGGQNVKDIYIKRLEEHYRADEIIQGTGWENGKGCMIGCIFDEYNHSLFESELGLTEELAFLVDKIFEGMTNKEAKEFPLEFIKAVNIRADLSKVCTKFKIYLLTDKEDGVINNIKKGRSYSDECIKAIQDVSDLLERSLSEDDTESLEEEAKSAWSEARSAARSVRSARPTGSAAISDSESAESATWCAAQSAWYAIWFNRSDARSTSKSIVSAVESAAYLTTETNRTTESDSYLKIKNKLIELIKEENNE